MTVHVFDQAIALAATGDGQYTGATSPAYANMVGPYGGITAATALNAVMQHPALLGEPLSLTVNFCAADAVGYCSVLPTNMTAVRAGPASGMACRTGPSAPSPTP